LHVIRENDLVLFYDGKRRKYVRTVRVGDRLETDLGYIDMQAAIGKEVGSTVSTSKGVRFYLLKPTLTDLIFTFRRPTQVIYPKDAGLILLEADIRPGMKVVEVGTGSGFLTAILSEYVGPEGRVYTYEYRREFLLAAKRNLSRHGLGSNVEFKLKDATRGIDERDVDVVVIDIADPWNVLRHAWEALKPSGRFASFSPTYNQVEKTCIEASKVGFIMLHTFEVLVRDIISDETRTRPASRMIAHTGFVTVGRKAVPPEES